MNLKTIIQRYDLLEAAFLDFREAVKEKPEWFNDALTIHCLDAAEHSLKGVKQTVNTLNAKSELGNCRKCGDQLAWEDDSLCQNCV